jgi:peptidyl-prolyl cis-trans isomerase SurA
LNRISSRTRSILATACLSAALGMPLLTHAADPVVLDRVVAVMDDSVILDSQVEQGIAELGQRLTAMKQPVPPADIMRKEVINQLILKNIQLDMIRRSGMTLDDASINAAVAEFAQKQGAPSLQAFQQALDQRQAGTYAKLRQQIAEDLSITRLRQQRVNARIKVNERDIDNFLASPQSQQIGSPEYRTGHMVVGIPENATAEQRAAAMQVAEKVNTDLLTDLSIDQIIARNNSAAIPVGGGDMGWRKPAELPEDMSSKITALSKGQTTGPIPTVQGIHIVKLLDFRSADKTIVHQWNVRHILISPNEVVSPADAKTRIDELYARLQEGGDFDTLAKTYSNDPGSSRNGGALNWVSPGDMVPAFEDMIKKTPVGDFSTPFQTQFGWHILQVQGERDEDMTEQYRRSMAHQVLFQRKFQQELENWLREIRANAFVELRGTDASLDIN